MRVMWSEVLAEPGIGMIDGDLALNAYESFEYGIDDQSPICQGWTEAGV